ncbi:hypothetical protein ARMSODRAFT_980646 [Armillaria solidipes]|uniref:Uncharacterized protein n=1 Tax=Armillaria solidipes TaxID=1076256 RepID=A0A2H3AV84_9AGAR|nr:hypothetical protein ARMSODRAFT_980646 [Armillaria solidipes]
MTVLTEVRFKDVLKNGMGHRVHMSSLMILKGDAILSGWAFCEVPVPQCLVLNSSYYPGRVSESTFALDDEFLSTDRGSTHYSYPRLAMIWTQWQDDRSPSGNKVKLTYLPQSGVIFRCTGVAAVNRVSTASEGLCPHYGSTMMMVFSLDEGSTSNRLLNSRSKKFSAKYCIKVEKGQ